MKQQQINLYQPIFRSQRRVRSYLNIDSDLHGCCNTRKLYGDLHWWDCDFQLADDRGHDLGLLIAGVRFATTSLSRTAHLLRYPIP